jgi:TM2 domain-containing membrane protein YozV
MPFKNKTLATLLAAVGGTFGLHRFYLNGAGRLLPWLYVLMCWTLIPTFAGFVEALRFALTPDERWDACWNADTGRTNDSGWPVILLAVLTMAGGVTLLMTVLAFGIGRVVGGSGETFLSANDALSRTASAARTARTVPSVG